MIRLENMLPKAFLFGIVEMVDMVGPDKTLDWIETIGRKMADIEGAGFEGARKNGIILIPICPCVSELIEFNELYGKSPSQFLQVIKCSNKRRDKSKQGWEYPVLTNILDVLHFSYSKQRAELAGAKFLNLGCKSPFTNINEYNKKALEKAGMTKDEVDKLLERAYCVFKIECPEKK